MRKITNSILQVRNRLSDYKSGNIKIFPIIILLFCVFFVNAAPKHVIKDTVIQEIRFVSSAATEVDIVWEIGNGIPIDSSNLPAGTVKDQLFYSPMQRGETYFFVKIRVPAGTKIDYVFRIRGGPKNTAIDRWDNNLPAGKYHTIALQNNITVIESTVDVRPAKPLTLLDYAFPLLGGSFLFLSGFIFFNRRYFRGWLPTAGPVTVVLSAAITLFLFLALIRPSVSGASWDVYAAPFTNLKRILIESYYDFLYVFILCFFFLLPLMFFKNFLRTRLFITALFLLICCMSLIAAILNIEVVGVLGKPFNYQWLYYSGFLRIPDAGKAISDNISASYTAEVFMIVLASIITGFLFSGAGSILLKNMAHRRIAFSVLLTGSSGFLVLGYHGVSKMDAGYNKLSNPVIAYFQSVIPFSDHPELFTMDVPDSLRYSEPVKSLSLAGSKKNKIKNVIVFVLESTPAEYLQHYGSKYKVTPNLAMYAGNAVTFENIYAHAPASNLSLVSLLGSVYPMLSYTGLTEEHPETELSSISEKLREEGYRTGFFNSADNRFQRAGEFLACRGFDTITDCRGENCGDRRFSLQSNPDILNAKNDECTRDEMMHWIRNRKDQPFFAMLWTYQTHYPYFTDGKEKEYEKDNPLLNRYLNALRHTDAVFGKMMSQLYKEKLMESTLVVVVGDHGEAFGRHGQVGHGRMVYEENLHVPCMFINPAFKPSRNPVVGGLVDVAPTIVHVLGMQEPAGWQGENLLAEKMNKRVYFFAPWSEFLFGYREGNQKYIYNATWNKTEIYDLAEDPDEQENLASFLPAEVALCHQRLAAWTQYVNAQMPARTAPKPQKQLASRK